MFVRRVIFGCLKKYINDLKGDFFYKSVQMLGRFGHDCQYLRQVKVEDIFANSFNKIFETVHGGVQRLPTFSVVHFLIVRLINFDFRVFLFLVPFESLIDIQNKHIFQSVELVLTGLIVTP